MRVSTVRKRRGARFISPTVQREAIQEWAARQGFKLNDVFEELDESGARADPPLLQRAIAQIEAGASDGLVVWRVDRFGRSLNDGVQIIERIRSAGGGFYSVHDGLDIDTEAGRLALRILLSVAEFQLEGIRAGWDAAREHAIRRGVHLNHIVPVGYRKTRSGRLRPHPRNARIMTELYRRRAGGDSLNTLARHLESENVLTGKGNPGWSASALSHTLRSRVYLGEVRSGPYVRSDAHEPLTDPATWQAAQHPLPATPPPHTAGAPRRWARALRRLQPLAQALHGGATRPDPVSTTAAANTTQQAHVRRQPSSPPASWSRT